VTEQQPRTRIGQRSILVALLVPAVIVGWIVGTVLGSTSNPNASPSPTPTPTTSAAPSSTPSPPATPTPTPAPTDEPAAGPRQVVLSVTGESHEITDTFEVKPGWQIHWQTDGTSIAVAVTGASNLGVLIDYPGPASGVTGVAEGGEYRLEIEANGPWSITVIDGEDPATS
jgi:hypothetical protein